MCCDKKVGTVHHNAHTLTVHFCAKFPKALTVYYNVGDIVQPVGKCDQNSLAAKLS